MQPLSPSLSRRQWFQVAGASALSLAPPLPRVLADEKPPAPPLAPLNRFPRTVQEFYVERVRAAEKIAADGGQSSRRRPTPKPTFAMRARRS